MPNLMRGVLQVRLAFARFGTGALIAGALLIGAALLWAVLLPGVSARVDQRGRAVAHARSMSALKPVVSAPALASQRLAAFYAALGDGAHTDGIVARLFDAASETGVALNKGEYKPAHDIAGRFDVYTIVLPVKGDYSSLRRFSEKVLASVPYAALDDMRFKRNSMSDQAVEANLRFTAFLRPATWGPVSATELVSEPASATATASASAQAPALATVTVTATAAASTSMSASASSTAVSPAALVSRREAAQPPASSFVRSLAPPLPPSMASALLAASVTIPALSPQPASPAPPASVRASNSATQPASVLARAPVVEVRR